MARSARTDPIEKYRFKVSVFDLDNGLLSFQANDKFTAGSISGDDGARGLVNAFSPFTSVDYNQFSSEIKAGFTEVTVPRARVSEIMYRENIDSLRSRKTAGLVTYEPITLRRGVVDDRGLYNWYKKVNNDINSLSPINHLLAANNVIPILPVDYRKDIVIEALDRTGRTRRAWLVFNAFPTEYSGGDGLNSSAEEKLVEEMILSYEAFVELPTADINQAIDESEVAAREAFASAAIAFAAGGLGGLL